MRLTSSVGSVGVAEKFFETVTVCVRQTFDFYVSYRLVPCRLVADDGVVEGGFQCSGVGIEIKNDMTNVVFGRVCTTHGAAIGCSATFDEQRRFYPAIYLKLIPSVFNQIGEGYGNGVPLVFRYLVSCRCDYDLLISDEKLWNTFEIRELKVVMDGGVEFAFCVDEVVFGGGVKKIHGFSSVE